MIEFTELNAPSLKELFINKLEALIISGELKIGEKLPSERELAKSLKVSRSVINAGLLDLASKGFIEIQARSGAYVSDFRRTGKMGVLVSIMKYNGGNFSYIDFKSLAEYRDILKKLAAKLAIKRITEKELLHLSDLAADLRQATNPTDMARIATEFDHELTVLSGNTILPIVFSSFKEGELSLLKKYFSVKGIHSFYSALTEQLVLCIKEKDEKGAIASIDKGTNDVIYGDTSKMMV